MTESKTILPDILWINDWITRLWEWLFLCCLVVLMKEFGYEYDVDFFISMIFY